MSVRERCSCLLVALVCAIPALAGEGRFPVYQTGTVITQSGAYRLTRNIPNNPDGPAITIAARRVTLDLNGFVVQQNTNSADPAILISEPKADVLIRNGKVLAAGSAVRYYGSLPGDPDNSLRIEDVHFETPGSFTCIDTKGLSTVNVMRVTLRGCATGIKVDCSSCGSRATEGRITGSSFLQSDYAISLNKVRGFEVAGNQVLNQSGGHTAITIENSTSTLVSGNALQYGGIQLVNVQGSEIRGNTIEGRLAGGSFGISDDSASRSNRIVENTIEDVDLDGILIQGGNDVVAENVTNNCGGFGIKFDAGSFDSYYWGNLAVGNGGTTCSSPVGGDACLDGTGLISGGNNAFAGALQ